MDDKISRFRKDNLAHLASQSFAAKAASKLQQQQEQVFTTKPNRICIMPDCSGSMTTAVKGTGKTRFAFLQEALNAFAESVEFVNTSVCFNAIGTDVSTPLIDTPAEVFATIKMLSPDGSTPMGGTMLRALESQSITRAILISDGEPTDGRLYEEASLNYQEAGIPIDCVHISSETSGEAVLTYIAAKTGGIYIKFDDLGSFARSFRYLSPKHRGLLTAPDAAALIGAKEIK